MLATVVIKKKFLTLLKLWSYFAESCSPDHRTFTVLQGTHLPY